MAVAVVLDHPFPGLGCQPRIDIVVGVLLLAGSVLEPGEPGDPARYPFLRLQHIFDRYALRFQRRVRCRPGPGGDDLAGGHGLLEYGWIGPVESQERTLLAELRTDRREFLVRCLEGIRDAERERGPGDGRIHLRAVGELARIALVPQEVPRF